MHWIEADPRSRIQTKCAIMWSIPPQEFCEAYGTDLAWHRPWPSGGLEPSEMIVKLDLQNAANVDLFRNMAKFVLLVERSGHAVTFSSLGQLSTVRRDLVNLTLPDYDFRICCLRSFRTLSNTWNDSLSSSEKFNIFNLGAAGTRFSAEVTVTLNWALLAYLGQYWVDFTALKVAKLTFWSRMGK